MSFSPVAVDAGENQAPRALRRFKRLIEDYKL